jgi:hypothetical protein
MKPLENDSLRGLFHRTVDSRHAHTAIHLFPETENPIMATSPIRQPMK